MSAEAIEGLMFDDSFERSKVYFTTLQLLRIFSDIIRGTGQDLQDNRSERDPSIFSEKYFGNIRRYWGELAEPEIDLLKKSWDLVLKHQDSAEKGLLLRIAGKTAEISAYSWGSVRPNPRFFGSR